MNLVDTHVHFFFPEFTSDSSQVIEQARQAGVRFFVNVGTDLETSRKSVAIAQRYDFIYATVGIHPHDVKDATPEDMRELAALAKHPKVVAIGEVGLDFYRNLSLESVQRDFIVQFFELAKETNLPLVLHIREAYEAMIQLLKAHFRTPIRAVSHCFSGSMEVMKELLGLGLFISFAGPVTYKKNGPLREAVRACPEDRILIETDAPFLAPQTHRGKRNEPAFMVETARQIAEIKGISLEKLGEMVSRNSETLFKRPFWDQS